MTALTLNLEPVLYLTHEQFRKLCQLNPDLKLERTAEGRLIVMPPTGWESGNRNANLTADLIFWNRQAKLGMVFNS
jgi:Uma2 family endonuclease